MVEIVLKESQMIKRTRDLRLKGLFYVALGVLVVGSVVSMIPGRGVEVRQTENPKLLPGFEALRDKDTPSSEWSETQELPDRSAHIEQKRGLSVAQNALSETRALIKQKKYDEALHRLNQDRDALKGEADAYFLIGHVLERKRDFRTARDFYNAATDRNPFLADAYWGFATTSEALGDLDLAIGGMRNYLHTEPDPDPMRLRINQARSAIWEWESKLGRGPWGPTRGVPPGFTQEDLKRDGRGVGVKWPKIETLQPDGTMKSEIKTAEKIKIYPRP